MNSVLVENPLSEKALYHEAFCKRLDGRHKEAIENLTKIIKIREKRNKYDLGSNSITSDLLGSNEKISLKELYGSLGIQGESDNRRKGALVHLPSVSTSGAQEAAVEIPLFRIYEMRGTLLHEAQAYSFALADLGRALALSPERATTMYLRADCHSKLGSYELAIRDFDFAEELVRIVILLFLLLLLQFTTILSQPRNYLINLFC